MKNHPTTVRELNPVVDPSTDTISEEALAIKRATQQYLDENKLNEDKIS